MARDEGVQSASTMAPEEYWDHLRDVLERLDRQGSMPSPVSIDVYAATPDVRVLSLSDRTLHKLMAEEPALAAKLLFNISVDLISGRSSLSASVGMP